MHEVILSPNPMKDIQPKAIATHALRFFIAIFAVSFVLEIGFQLIKGVSFGNAYAYWQASVSNAQKLIVYLVSAIAFGIYKARKEAQGGK